MKNHLVLFLISAIGISLLFPSCFAPQEGQEIVAEGDMRQVVINVISINQKPFSRAYGAESVTHLDFAIFDNNGTKIVKVNQRDTDNDFMHPTVSLSVGEYRLVIVAHSGNGTATITSPTEVTFPDNKVTDTFAYYGTLSITDQTASSSDVNVEMARVVSMVRLIMTDSELPSDLAQLKFYYTGGSSTFNPQTGFGSKNSRQTEYRSLAGSTVDENGYHLFEIYTFPHIVSDELKLTITPMDADGTKIANERILDGIPIELNMITELKGAVLVGTTLNITIDDEWDGTMHYEF